MIKHLITLTVAGSISLAAAAQAKFGDNKTNINPGSLLELESTTKGTLLTRVALSNTTTWGLAGNVPAAGMVVYNSDAAITSTNAAYPILPGGVGMYYWDGTGWVAMKMDISRQQADSTFWALKGNTGTNAGTNELGENADGNYLGTTDLQNLVLGTNGKKRMMLDTLGNVVGGTVGSISFPAGYPKAYGGRSIVWGGSIADSAIDGISVGEMLSKAPNAPYTALFGVANKVGSSGAASIVAGSDNTVCGSHNAMSGQNNIDSARWGITSGDYLLKGINHSYSALFGKNNQMLGGAPVPWAVGSGGSIMGGRDNKSYGRYVSVFGYNNIDSSSHTSMTGQSNVIGNNGDYSMVHGFQNTLINMGTDAGASLGLNFVIGGQNKLYILGTKGVAYNLVSGLNNQLLNTNTGNLSIPGSVGANYNVINGNINKVVGASYAIVSGWQNTDSADHTLVIGRQNEMMPQATASAALGQYNKMYGQRSIAVGLSNLSYGNHSITVGESNKTLSNAAGAAVFGQSNIDSASYVLAAGADHQISAGANYSAVLGQGNSIIADMPHATVIGKFNAPKAGALLQVGAGSGSAPVNRKNAFEVYSQNIILPKGTTAERPTTPEPGSMRYNTTTGRPEVYVEDLNNDGVLGDAGWLKL